MSETLSLPSLAVLVIVTVLLVRYVFTRSSAVAASSQPYPGSGRGREINAEAVEQVASMFPQLDRRTIAWDLLRNGGSVGATAERVLSGRELDAPPPSFRPLNLGLPYSAISTSTTLSPMSPTYQDLITRYGLSSKLNVPASDQAGSASPAENGPERGKTHTWAPTKDARAAMLQRRREEMILQARRKMEERDRKGKGAEEQ